MKISCSCRRITAYHKVVASPDPWMRCHGRGTVPSGSAIAASVSWRWVAT